MGLLGRIRDKLSLGSDSPEKSPKPSNILYVDEIRLNHYFEQISNPVTYDEVSELETKSSITDPSLTHRLRKSGRPFTREEKISTFVEYLEENELVTTHRPFEAFPSHEKQEGPSPSDEERDSGFRLERMVARRGHVPSPSDDDRMDDLWIWASEYTKTPPSNIPEAFSEPVSSNISEEHEEILDPPEHREKIPHSGHLNEIGPLILIEESFQPSDKPSRFTGVSTLMALISSREEDEKLKKLDDTALDISFNEEQEFHEKDALSVLTTAGAEFGRKRDIVSLYSVELVYHDEANDFAVTTFGYPIVIWEA